MLEVSVVVPVRDGAASLPVLLESLAAQDLEAERYEVIVVDNASGDGSGELAASLGARVAFEAIPNRSRARNAGASTARTDLFAFIDADCTASPQWLSALLACRGRASLVAGPVEIETRTPANAIERFESFWRFDQESTVAQGWAATANLMVERSAFDAVGGFDPEYRHIGEDADFCLRDRWSRLVPRSRSTASRLTRFRDRSAGGWRPSPGAPTRAGSPDRSGPRSAARGDARGSGGDGRLPGRRPPHVADRLA
jgi:glycosyltransferase involved in cell wall biosynthesis